MSVPPPLRVPTADELRAVFDASKALTIGLEEELMVLDPGSLDLAPIAEQVLERMAGDARFKRELPAAQIEIVTPPARSVPQAIEALATARRALAETSGDLARFAAAGTHPFAGPDGVLNRHERYRHTLTEYGPVARRQLVFALQVHVAVGGAERSLAVYNALRSHLPELAALAANAPFHAGRDSGLASARPKIAETLPRQGIPPAIESWESFAGALRWGAASGSVPEPRLWWWELRPHTAFGTLEIRVPDAQVTVREAGAVAAVAHSLVAWLAARHDAGEVLPVHPTWRLEENRWSACRHGVHGRLSDPDSGRTEPTAERLGRLLDDLEPIALELGCASELAHGRALAHENGSDRQRAQHHEGDPTALTRWLADRFTEGTGDPDGLHGPAVPRPASSRESS